MVMTFDGVFSGIYANYIESSRAHARRAQAVSVEDADNAAWRLEPGHYVETQNGLVAATPELASLAISWSRG